ncbi:hypothetical protein B0H16DRAFT_1448381 [Mycena metata]|uniref:Uncharacterized protein n=1 Tax=Mycena metata TaxID=1033252 RepID=A0AAD7K7H6_9AGAR|nr:hypothetical protein B0H16DRAFT_1448381 [Mycena metata]
MHFREKKRDFFVKVMFQEEIGVALGVSASCIEAVPIVREGRFESPLKMQARYLTSRTALHPRLKVPLARRQFHSRSTLHNAHPPAAPAHTGSMYFRPPRPDIYAPFHRTTLPIAPWSTAWETYTHIRFFTTSFVWHDLSRFDFYVQRVMQIPGPLRPIAFLPDVPEADILFEAGGEYYEVDTLQSWQVRYGGGFSGPDAFLRRLPHLEGLIAQFPDSTDDLYAEVCYEQHRLMEAAAQKPYN